MGAAARVRRPRGVGRDLTSAPRTTAVLDWSRLAASRSPTGKEVIDEALEVLRVADRLRAAPSRGGNARRLRGRHMGPRAPRRLQGRGRPPRGPRLNARFVVTNLVGKAKRIYERVYCARGDAENRIKELFDVAFDRTSCSRFAANQFRVLLATAACVLLQELRLAARGTAWARAGEHAAARVARDRRAGDRLRAPHRPATAGRVPVPRRLADARAAQRRQPRLSLCRRPVPRARTSKSGPPRGAEP